LYAFINSIWEIFLKSVDFYLDSAYCLSHFPLSTTNPRVAGSNTKPLKELPAVALYRQELQCRQYCRFFAAIRGRGVVGLLRILGKKKPRLVEQG